MNQLLGTAAIWPTEFAVNQLIKADRHLQSTVKRFDGDLLEIKASSPAINLCLQFLDSGIRLSALSSDELNVAPTACIAAKLSTLVQLLVSTPESNALSNPELTISGDAGFVHDVFKSIQTLDLRWDDFLAPWLGDVPTELARSSSDSFKQWGRQSLISVSASVNDYLTEESRLLPTNNSVEQFRNRQDQLRLRIDRARARIDRLNEKLNP